MNAITIVKKGDRHVALFRWSTETKDRVKAAGFRFDGTRKEWWTNDTAIAASLNGGSKPAPQNDYRAPVEPRVVSNTDIPVPEGLEYLPFQKEGIRMLMQRKYALLGDDMGLGKSVQAIGLINAKPDIKRVLLICPASLKINWRNELMKWLVRDFVVITGSSKPAPEISQTLVRAFAFADEIRTDSDQKSCNVSSATKPPIKLGFGADNPALSQSFSDTEKTAIGAKEPNQTFVGVSESDLPWIVSRSGAVFTNPSLSIDNAGHISQNNRHGRNDKIGRMAPNETHRLSHQAPEMITQGTVSDAQLASGHRRLCALLDAVERSKQISIAYTGRASQGVVLILNYDIVANWRPIIDRINFDIMILDECHYLKNGKAARTQAVIGKWADAPADRVLPINATRKLWITGTPVLNRPKELWVVVRALDRNGLGQDWHAFHTRYCAAYKDGYGWQLDGNSNLDELQDRLRNGIMVRRKKTEVLKELPAKRRQVFLLPAESADAKKMLELEKELLPTKERLDKLRAEVEALSVNQADLAYKKAVQALEKAEGVAFSDTARVRHQTALAKLPAAIDHLANVLESESKIVVFAYHHDVVDGLVKGLAEHGVVKIDGRDTPGDRQKAVEAFQTDPAVRVIVGSIGAMGVGLTLTAASYCGFVELDWVPGNMAQAEDRLHRIGQAESVLVQHIMLDGSFDGYMAATVVAKLRVIEKAVG